MSGVRHLSSEMQTGPKRSIILDGHLSMKKTDYFKPSDKQFMINYRVNNIEGLVKKLRDNGVTIVDEYPGI